ncbi:MAG: type I CRISPR-associated protein Cas7 [Deltaproteobacteria bacterium]|nr:type I CRISPR-associated protein Cas7 [Deltaproteobacteria bacterium]
MSAQEQELWQKIQKQPYCDPTKRMDFVLFFDVRDGNPNGDPDAGNLPRMDPQTRQGIVTDVCIKRKIRDYLATLKGDNGAPLCSIYIQSQSALNNLYYKAARKMRDYDSENDMGANDQEKERKKQEAEVVGALLVQLDACDNEKFRDLIAEPESEDNSSSEGDKNFRDWLEDVSKELDELEFDPSERTLSYMGEASAKKTFNKKKFTGMLMQEEFEPDKYKSQINSLATLLAEAKPNKAAEERKARELVKWKMCELYDDMRLFGGVLTAGTNAGQIRGPMQLTFGRSVEPILQMDAAITRCAITTASDWKKKQTEFGRKPWLSWAVYRQHGFYNPLLGQQTGVASEDLARFWEALACMFRNSDSASKGEMTMHDVIVFVHDHPRGNAPSHLLFDKVNCEPTEYKGRNGDNEKDDVTMIKRDGFDNCYTIRVGTSTNDKIKVGRPLRDLWKQQASDAVSPV